MIENRRTAESCAAAVSVALTSRRNASPPQRSFVYQPRCLRAMRAPEVSPHRTPVMIGKMRDVRQRASATVGDDEDACHGRRKWLISRNNPRPALRRAADHDRRRRPTSRSTALRLLGRADVAVGDHRKNRDRRFHGADGPIFTGPPRGARNACAHARPTDKCGRSSAMRANRDRIAVLRIATVRILSVTGTSTRTTASEDRSDQCLFASSASGGDVVLSRGSPC